MSKTLSNQPVTNVAEIVRHGEAIQIPEGMSMESAVDVIMRRMKYEQEQMEVTEQFDVFPWDGAVALHTVLTRKYGWAQAIPTPGFWGDKPPQLIAVDVGHDRKIHVPWGRFSLPNIEGFLDTSHAKSQGRFVFAIKATILRKSEYTVKDLLQELRKEIATNSIYRGKAIKMRFRNKDGEVLKMPDPRFLDTSGIDEGQLVYSDHVMRAIDTNLFTPIRRVHDCLANGIQLKRGVLLGGTYGTGKTLAAAVASKLAVEAGVTYVYVPRADELADAIQFAKQYQSPACVIFCEDIDRVVSGERSVAMDDILNIIDGIDSKTSNIIVVLTTNDLNSINPAMLRPGRLDAVIEVTKPDAGAVEKLIRLYGRGIIAPHANLEKVGAVLAGNIPAVIAEVVKRTKLAQLKLQEPGTRVELITEDALLDAAQTMQAQVDLLQRTIDGDKQVDNSLEAALQGTVRRALNGHGETVNRIHRDVLAVSEAVGVERG